MMRATEQTAARLHAVTGNDDHLVGTVLAAASDANLAAAGPDRLIALAKGRDQSKAAAGEPAKSPLPDGSVRQVMAHRLRTPEGRALYKRRGATVEPPSATSRPSSTDSPGGT